MKKIYGYMVAALMGCGTACRANEADDLYNKHVLPINKLIEDKKNFSLDALEKKMDDLGNFIQKNQVKLRSQVDKLGFTPELSIQELEGNLMLGLWRHDLRKYNNGDQRALGLIDTTKNWQDKELKSDLESVTFKDQTGLHKELIGTTKTVPYDDAQLLVILESYIRHVRDAIKEQDIQFFQNILHAILQFADSPDALLYGDIGAFQDNKGKSFSDWTEVLRNEVLAVVTDPKDRQSANQAFDAIKQSIDKASSKYKKAATKMSRRMSTFASGLHSIAGSKK